MSDATLFLGGRCDTGRRRVDALLVEGGRVVAAGAEGAVRSATPAGAERVDLAGASVVPGLVDAHLHLGDIARLRRGFPAGSPRSVGELRQRLAAWAEEHPAGPVVGGGFDPLVLAERRWPTLEELDGAVRDRPVVLYHVSGHVALVNARARQLAFGSGTPPPAGTALPGSVVAEDGLRALAGVVHEAGVLSSGELEEAVLAVVRLGVTTVGTMSTNRQELRLLGELEAAGRLPLKVRAYPTPEEFPEPLPRAAGPDARLRVAGVKLFLDGAFGPRTAALREPYADEAGAVGVDRGSDTEVAAVCAAAAERRLGVAVHAIGDRAVARAARLLAPHARNGLRARVEHAGLTPPDLLAALAGTGIVLVGQPGFLLTDLWLRERLGPARARWAYAFRSQAEQGLPVAGSSDAPYGPLDPWLGMRAAVDRADGLGRSANPSPSEGLSPREAMAVYTVGGHLALGEPDVGTLEPGAPADLLVLDLPRPEAALRAVGPVVRERWVDGRRVELPGSPDGARR